MIRVLAFEGDPSSGIMLQRDGDDVYVEFAIGHCMFSVTLTAAEARDLARELMYVGTDLFQEGTPL